MDFTQLKELVLYAVLSLLGLGGIYIITLASKYLREKLAAAKLPLISSGEVSEVARGLFDTVSSVIEKTAAASVGKLEQLVAKDLRELVRDGKANREDLLALAIDAYHEVVTTVAPGVIEDLRDYVCDTEQYIRNVIEAELLKLKGR